MSNTAITRPNAEPLSAKEFTLMNPYWRAANYPFVLAQVKPLVIRHSSPSA